MPTADDTWPGVSIAGGASLAIVRSSRRKDAAWHLIEYLSEPEQQVAFYRLTGDLPSRTTAWREAALTTDRYAGAFWRQLQAVVPTPKIPEWEQIAAKVAYYAERASRGAMTADEAVTALDRDVDALLEKRRWLLQQRRR
jgi:multiple sugar transport system substrate-binding protein